MVIEKFDIDELFLRKNNVLKLRESIGEDEHLTDVLFVHSTRQQLFTEILQRFHIVFVGHLEHVFGELVNRVHHREIVRFAGGCERMFDVS